MRRTAGNSGETGMFGPETDLIISLAAVLILFISIEKKKNNDELKSVKAKQVEVMKAIRDSNPEGKNLISDDSLLNGNRFQFHIYSKKTGYEDAVTIENFDFRQKFTFSEQTLFSTNEFLLKDRGGKILKTLSDILNQSSQAIEEVKIDGHASIDGDKDSNLDLAGKRAIEVFKFLRNSDPKSCFNPKKKLISAASYGHYSPVGRKRNEEFNEKIAEIDKPKNRRIEIVLTYKPD
ncbi:MAG: OmpA family protein [Arcicella sp.]|jgi:outer membrane protein OmpA-like peptidoglycan-associated protein|nr:OmpA family protein [Arcicella sp.]